MPWDLLLATLGLSLGVQAVFFAFAATLRTDKVTDLSYGLTFILLAVWLAWQRPDARTAGVVLAAMVVLWGVRLAGYLFYRILRIGRDARFDGVRERPLKFLQFWFFQGVVVWTVMLPVTLWFATPVPWQGWMAIPALTWALGLAIETVADAQKFRHKMRPGGGSRWVDTGLWRLSRHPNYFGELVCWWAVFAFVAPSLGWLAIPAALGPIVITYILLAVTGVPTLEAGAERKWGDNAGYLAYRARTRLLVPWPRQHPRVP
jgi:steroid 5-alpha reductase family enzyme